MKRPNKIRGQLSHFSKALGKYLKDKREQAGLSQGQVAKALKYNSSQFISNFERGLCAPAASTFRALIDLYRISPHEVLEFILVEQKKYFESVIFSKVEAQPVSNSKKLKIAK